MILIIVAVFLWRYISPNGNETSETVLDNSLHYPIDPGGVV